MSTPKNTEQSPLFCPWCGQSQRTGGGPVEIIGIDTKTNAILFDKNGIGETGLDEYQCRNEGCGRSFWV